MSLPMYALPKHPKYKVGSKLSPVEVPAVTVKSRKYCPVYSCVNLYVCVYSLQLHWDNRTSLRVQFGAFMSGFRAHMMFGATCKMQVLSHREPHRIAQAAVVRFTRLALLEACMWWKDQENKNLNLMRVSLENWATGHMMVTCTECIAYCLWWFKNIFNIEIHIFIMRKRKGLCLKGAQ